MKLDFLRIFGTYLLAIACSACAYTPPDESDKIPAAEVQTALARAQANLELRVVSTGTVSIIEPQIYEDNGVIAVCGKILIQQPNRQGREVKFISSGASFLVIETEIAGEEIDDIWAAICSA